MRTRTKGFALGSVSASGLSTGGRGEVFLCARALGVGCMVRGMCVRGTYLSFPLPFLFHLSRVCAIRPSLHSSSPLVSLRPYLPSRAHSPVYTSHPSLTSSVSLAFPFPFPVSRVLARLPSPSFVPVLSFVFAFVLVFVCVSLFPVSVASFPVPKVAVYARTLTSTCLFVCRYQVRTRGSHRRDLQEGAGTACCVIFSWA